MNPEPLYLEDLRVGRRFVSGEYRMDLERIKSFAAEFDPQPFHLDERAASASVLGGLAASGWHRRRHHAIAGHRRNTFGQRHLGTGRRNRVAQADPPRRRFARRSRNR